MLVLLLKMIIGMGPVIVFHTFTHNEPHRFVLWFGFYGSLALSILYSYTSYTGGLFVVLPEAHSLLKFSGEPAFFSVLVGALFLCIGAIFLYISWETSPIRSMRQDISRYFFIVSVVSIIVRFLSRATGWEFSLDLHFFIYFSVLLFSARFRSFIFWLFGTLAMQLVLIGSLYLRELVVFLANLIRCLGVAETLVEYMEFLLTLVALSFSIFSVYVAILVTFPENGEFWLIAILLLLFSLGNLLWKQHERIMLLDNPSCPGPVPTFEDVFTSNKIHFSLPHFMGKKLKDSAMTGSFAHVQRRTMFRAAGKFVYKQTRQFVQTTRDQMGPYTKTVVTTGAIGMGWIGAKGYIEQNAQIQHNNLSQIELDHRLKVLKDPNSVCDENKIMEESRSILREINSVLIFDLMGKKPTPILKKQRTTAIETTDAIFEVGTARLTKKGAKVTTSLPPSFPAPTSKKTVKDFQKELKDDVQWSGSDDLG